MWLKSPLVLLSIVLGTSTVLADNTELSACARLKRQTYVFNVDDKNVDSSLRGGGGGGQWTLVLPFKSERVIVRRESSFIFWTKRVRLEIDGDRLEQTERGNLSDYYFYHNCITSPDSCMFAIEELKKLIYAVQISAPSGAEFKWAVQCATERAERMAKQIAPYLPNQMENSDPKKGRLNPLRPGGSGNPFDPGNHSNPFSPKL